MNLSGLLKNLSLVCILSLVFFVFSTTPVSSGAVNPCDDPGTPTEIEPCVIECSSAGDCNCQQSSACIGGVCSCTVDGIGGSNWQYCSECENNYQSCSSSGGGLFEIRWCGGGSGPQGRCIPDGVPNATLSCDGGPGSFNQMDGFVYKQYARVHI